MAELATIARPYAEALFKAAGDDSAALKPQLAHLAQLASNAELRQFADNPTVPASQVLDLFAGVAVSQGVGIDAKVGDIVEPRRDTRQVPDAVAVRIQEAARINLIDHRSAPPGRCFGYFGLRAELISEHRTPHSPAAAG